MVEAHPLSHHNYNLQLPFGRCRCQGKTAGCLLQIKRFAKNELVDNVAYRKQVDLQTRTTSSVIDKSMPTR